MSMALVKPGLYHHHKGGTYTVLFTAETHEHNGDIDVVYVSHTYGKICTRPLQRDSRNEDSWRDYVMWPDGVERLRFIDDNEYVCSKPPGESLSFTSTEKGEK